MRRKNQEHKVRKYLSSKVDIRQVFPLLLWCKCEKCGDEFRREYGWKYTVLSQKPLGWYICGTCCLDEDEVHTFFTDRIKRMRDMIVPPIEEEND